MWYADSCGDTLYITIPLLCQVFPKLFWVCGNDWGVHYYSPFQWFFPWTSATRSPADLRQAVPPHSCRAKLRKVRGAPEAPGVVFVSWVFGWWTRGWLVVYQPWKIWKSDWIIIPMTLGKIIHSCSKPTRGFWTKILEKIVDDWPLKWWPSNSPEV